MIGMTLRRTAVVFILLLIFSIMEIALVVYAASPAWETKAPMHEARSGLGVAVVNGKIYAIGGAGATGFSSTNEEYDPATNTWSLKSPMPTPRSAFGIAVYDNRIYCIGGYTNYANSSIVSTAVNEVYDPTTDTWTNKASMPTARLNLRASLANGKIYLIGGIPTPDTGRTINEVYDPESDTWTTKTPIPTGVDLYASAVVGSKIFVIKSGLTQIYNVESNSWSMGTSPPLNSNLPSAVTLTTSNSSARIYLIGADASGVYWQLTSQGYTTQSYDPATDNWTVCSPMPTGRFDAATAAISDKLYVIGGYSYGASSGLSPNRPIVYSTTNEQYTPLNDTSAVEKIQTTPTATAPSSTTSAVPTQLPTASPSPTLSPSPTPYSNSTASSAQTPLPSPSDSAFSTAESGAVNENESDPQFDAVVLFISLAVIAVIIIVIIVIAKKKHR
jgi:N-acetylneuraminic acid mutarotase